MLELEAMVVQLFLPLKLAGVHGDRWTVRLGISINFRCPAWPVGICPSPLKKDRHRLQRVHIKSAGDRDEFHDIEPMALADEVIE